MTKSTKYGFTYKHVPPGTVDTLLTDEVRATLEAILSTMLADYKAGTMTAEDENLMLELSGALEHDLDLKDPSRVVGRCCGCTREES